MTAAARKLVVPACAELCQTGGTRQRPRKVVGMINADGKAQTAISLCNDFRLTADAHCWILQQRRGLRKSRRGHKTEVMWRPISYHPSIRCALKSFGELRLRVGGAQSFQELLRVQKETQALIAEVLNHDQRD